MNSSLYFFRARLLQILQLPQFLHNPQILQFLRVCTSGHGAFKSPKSPNSFNSFKSALSGPAPTIPLNPSNPPIPLSLYSRARLLQFLQIPQFLHFLQVCTSGPSFQANWPNPSICFQILHDDDDELIKPRLRASS